jgi:uncharacterized membrane protein (UPF0127 family)
MSFNTLHATTFKQRLLGYMFQRKPKYEAILFKRPLMIHMFFVRFPLAVFVLDKKYKVLKKFIIKPWRISGFYPDAEYFLETAQLKTIKKIKQGTILNLKKINN